MGLVRVVRLRELMAGFAVKKSEEDAGAMAGDDEDVEAALMRKMVLLFVMALSFRFCPATHDCNRECPQISTHRITKK